MIPILLLAFLTLGSVESKVPSSATCTVQVIPTTRSAMATTVYQHNNIKSVTECVVLCAKNAFCLTAGFIPGVNEGGVCLLSYRRQHCDGKNVDPRTLVTTNDTIVLGCIKNECQAAQIQVEKGSIPSTPNILLMIADDFGYGDLASFGNPIQEWGPLDDMALKGIRFKQMYSSDSVCAPSRLALQTGRIPAIVGMYGGKARVFLPWDTQGLPHSEYVLPERLRDAGYTTGMAGKWHLGINSHNRTDGSFLPWNQGYDFAGIFLPYSNDWECDDTGLYQPQGPRLARCYMFNGTEMIQQPIHLESFTSKMVDSFKQFVTQYGLNPWFFYFAFPHTHTALITAKDFANTSRRGLYGDNMNEMNWAAGELLGSIENAGVTSKTLVVFTSDHGPHIEICESGGVTNGLKGGKSNCWEGGVRVPGIAYWPGVIRPGQVSWAIISHLDIYPTFANLAGTTMPSNGTYHGQLNTDALLGFKTTGPYEDDSIPLFYYCTDKVFAMRWKNYKFHKYLQPLAPDEEIQANCPGGWPLKSWYKGNTQCNDPEVKNLTEPQIYNLVKDPWESYPVTTDDDTYLESIYDEAVQLIEKQQEYIDTHKGPRLLNFENREVVPCCSGDINDCRCGYPLPYPEFWDLTYMSTDMSNATKSTKLDPRYGKK